MSAPGKLQRSSRSPIAASVALVTSDTSNRKPRLSTRPSDSRRSRIKPLIPRPGRGTTFQTASSAASSSIITAVAPIIRVPTPTTVPMIPDLGFDDRASASWIIFAVSSPNIDRSSSRMWPCAAAWPSTRPATDIATSSTGAMANTV